MTLPSYTARRRTRRRSPRKPVRIRAVSYRRLVADHAVAPRTGFELHVSEVLNCDFHKSFQHERCRLAPKVTGEAILPSALSPSHKNLHLSPQKRNSAPIFPYANNRGISTRRPPLGAGRTFAPRSRPPRYPGEQSNRRHHRGSEGLRVPNRTGSRRHAPEDQLLRVLRAQR